MVKCDADPDTCRNRSCDGRIPHEPLTEPSDKGHGLCTPLHYCYSASMYVQCIPVEEESDG